MSRSRWYTRRSKNHYLTRWKEKRREILHSVSPREHWYGKRNKTKKILIPMKSGYGTHAPKYLRPSERSFWSVLTVDVYYGGC